MTLIEVLKKAVAEETQVYNMMVRVNEESGMGEPKKLQWVIEAEAVIKEYDADRDFEKDIADIIKEIKRSPVIISEQRYNQWYCRLVTITERQYIKANEKASEITDRCIAREVEKSKAVYKAAKELYDLYEPFRSPAITTPEFVDKWNNLKEALIK